MNTLAFDGDTIIDSTLQHPLFVYTGCGDFNVSLTALDATHPPRTITRNAYVRTDVLQASFTECLSPTGRSTVSTSGRSSMISSPSIW